jgi:hypothetical protein
MVRLWACGHERTEANTKPVGSGRSACRQCFRRLDRDYRRARRQRERTARDSDAMLGTKPEGLNPEGVAARAEGIAHLHSTSEDS